MIYFIILLSYLSLCVVIYIIVHIFQYCYIYIYIPGIEVPVYYSHTAVLPNTINKYCCTGSTAQHSTVRSYCIFTRLTWLPVPRNLVKTEIGRKQQYVQQSTMAKKKTEITDKSCRTWRRQYHWCSSPWCTTKRSMAKSTSKCAKRCS